MPSLTPVLHIRALSKSYRQGIYGHETTCTVLRNLNLDIYAKECVAIVGTKGTGKTTLLYCLAGMLPPTSGSIHWQLPHNGEKPDIAYIPEKATYYGFLTLTEILEYYITGRDLTTTDRAHRITSALAQVGLMPFGQTRIRDLPSEFLHRLRLAQALVGHPQIILVDELISSLAPSALSALKPLLQTLTSSGLTVIMTTHNYSAATALATRIIPMSTHPRHSGAVISLHPLTSRIALPMS